MKVYIEKKTQKKRTFVYMRRLNYPFGTCSVLLNGNNTLFRLLIAKEYTSLHILANATCFYLTLYFSFILSVVCLFDIYFVMFFVDHVLYRI